VSSARREVLRIGDRIRFAGAAHTVVGLSGNLVRLSDGHGRASVVQLPHLLADASFEPAAGQGSSVLAGAGLLGTVSSTARRPRSQPRF